jgi:hypothetical protein
MGTIDELRAKATEIDDAVDATIQSTKQKTTWVVAGFVLLALLAFVLGRRGGKKVVVEVRRR